MNVVGTIRHANVDVRTLVVDLTVEVTSETMGDSAPTPLPGFPALPVRRILLTTLTGFHHLVSLFPHSHQHSWLDAARKTPITFVVKDDTLDIMGFIRHEETR